MGKNLQTFLKGKNLVVLFIFILIVFYGNKLRNFSYDSVPHPGETADEYEYAWVGLSLIKDRIPVGWTGIENAYKTYASRKINVDNLYDKEPGRAPFIIVSPMLEKPPGFPLLIGAYSYIKGAKEFSETGVGIIRRPMLRIATLTTILLFILAWRLYGPFVATLSTALYSTIPTIVFSSRIVVPENAYIPLFLGALILVDLYLEKKKKFYWISAAILSALGFLVKQSALSILLAIVLIFAFYLSGKMRSKILISTFFIGVLGLLAFLLYGAYYDWGTFVKIFLAQSQLIYGAGSEAFFSAVTHPKVTATKFFTDGWILVGWISFLILSFIEWKKERGGVILTLSVFSCLVVFLIFGGEGYGWYRFPFYPFLAISTARIVQRLIMSPNLPVFISLALLPFGTATHRLVGFEGFQNYVPHLRLFLIFVLGLFALSIWFPRNIIIKRTEQVFMILVLAFLIFLSAKEVYFYTYDKWFFAN